MADLTRAEALRDLIGKGLPENYQQRVNAVWGAGLDCGDVWPAFDKDDLNAVARLEAPLRGRGWEGPELSGPAPSLSSPDDDVVEQPGDDLFTTWSVRWELRGEGEPYRGFSHGRALTEARARLLAVLRALLHEAEAS